MLLVQYTTIYTLLTFRVVNIVYLFNKHTNVYVRVIKTKQYFLYWQTRTFYLILEYVGNSFNI